MNIERVEQLLELHHQVTKSDLIARDMMNVLHSIESEIKKEIENDDNEQTRKQDLSHT